MIHRREQYTLDEVSEFSRDRSGLAKWMAVHGAPEPIARQMAAAIRWTAPEPIRAQDPIDDGHELAIGSSRWLVLHTPGHTAGHICLHDPAGRVLITGDHMLPNESSNISVRPSQPYDPLGSYLLSLERVLALDPALSLPGHGQPFGDLRARPAPASAPLHEA